MAGFQVLPARQTSDTALAEALSRGAKGYMLGEERRGAQAFEEKKLKSKETQAQLDRESRETVAGMRKGKGGATSQTMKQAFDAISAMEKIKNPKIVEMMNTPVVKDRLGEGLGIDLADINLADTAQRSRLLADTDIKIKASEQEEKMFVQAQGRAQKIRYQQTDILGNRTQVPLYPAGVEKAVLAGGEISDADKRTITTNFMTATAGAEASDELLRTREILRQMIISETGFDPQRTGVGRREPFKILKKETPTVKPQKKEKSLRSLTEAELFKRMQDKQAAGEDISAERAIAKKRGYLR